MNTYDKAEMIFQKSIEEALGYIELAKDQQAAGRDTEALADAAIKALQRFSEHDELIDAMYDSEHDDLL